MGTHYRSFTDKDNKIIELTEKNIELERKMLDMDENLRAKDELIRARTAAVTLMSAGTYLIYLFRNAKKYNFNIYFEILKF